MPVAKSPLPTTSRKPMESTASVPNPESNRRDRHPRLSSLNPRANPMDRAILLNEKPMGHGDGGPLPPRRRGRTRRTPVLLVAMTNLGRCGDSGRRYLLNEEPIGHGVGAPGRPHPRHAKLLDLSLLHATVALGSSARSSSASSTTTSLTSPRPSFFAF